MVERFNNWHKVLADNIANLEELDTVEKLVMNNDIKLLILQAIKPVRG